MNSNSTHGALVSLTVRLGADLKADLRECASKLELSENDIAKHAIKAAVQFIKAMGYCQGPPFKMMLEGKPEDPPAPV